MWSVRIDADTGADYSEALDAHLRERLAARHPAAGAAYAAGRQVADRVSIQLSIDGSTVRQAIDAAVREVTAALREFGVSARAVRVEALPEDELDEELRQTPPELMGVREIAELLDVTRQRADQLSRRDDFPQPLQTLAAGAIWPGAAVRRWAATWERKGGRPKAVKAVSE
ncbi:hypothetical protein [Spongiactinospora rosea]|uniref:hypothetical protein n=1 Tax=Spongiactinospora rosea TaxID=2248750 RepID=UPI0011C03DD2|nr:hypothetical protein [Spongiactinospora rosea]